MTPCIKLMIKSQTLGKLNTMKRAMDRMYTFVVITWLNLRQLIEKSNQMNSPMPNGCNQLRKSSTDNLSPPATSEPRLMTMKIVMTAISPRFDGCCSRFASRCGSSLIKSSNVMLKISLSRTTLAKLGMAVSCQAPQAWFLCLAHCHQLARCATWWQSASARNHPAWSTLSFSHFETDSREIANFFDRSVWDQWRCCRICWPMFIKPPPNLISFV